MTRLPPLRLLVTFEAVARLGAMREAALELNVSQPAITQAVKALEEHIGVGLMDRSRKPARLTLQGHLLARAVGDGLQTIGNTIDELRAGADTKDRRVTVSCTLGMATYWLMPRLPEFYARHPDIVVNVQTTQTDNPSISPGVDLALRYGNGAGNNGATTALFDELVCPVGKPALIKQMVDRGQQLDMARLIHVRSPAAHHWTGWDEYLKQAGLTPPLGTGEIFDNYVQAVQAALDGRGLILGWRSITAGLVNEGALAAWPNGDISVGTAYSATLSANAASKESAQAFLAWLGGADSH